MSDKDRQPGSLPLLVSGPVIATAHFLVVYLAAEAACANDIHGFDTAALRVVIAAASAAAAIGLLVTWRRASRMRAAARGADAEEAEDRHFGATAGMILLGLFAYMVLLVGASVMSAALC